MTVKKDENKRRPVKFWFSLFFTLIELRKVATRRLPRHRRCYCVPLCLAVLLLLVLLCIIIIQQQTQKLHFYANEREKGENREMDKIQFLDSTGIPFTREGLYATNNQFQKAGPKGFIQVKVLENDSLYIRVDLPGVPDDAIRHRVDSVRQKVIFFSGETPNDGNPKDGVREYSGTAGLGCDCCEITGVDAKMKDGVLRMIVTRVKVKDHENKCTLTLPPFTGNSGRSLEDHPFVVKGRKTPLLGAPLPNGVFYVAVDVPGVCPGDVEVLANEDKVRFYAEVKNVYEHDESARVFLGRLILRGGSSSCPLPSLLTRTLACELQFGVLKIVIAPPPRNDDNTTTTKSE
ncbi:unnamed protein product [Thlaspi arvense]|uniref:Uncharacterized protein n=1 Tax=Thlaspi arvense TaxID=13288 RepID=A0AAU9RRW4_THLAR|nr:unnamed protein product [Thlaspi arvense]